MKRNTDKPIYIGNVYNKGGEKGSDGGNVYDPSGISRTLTSYGGRAAQTYILEPSMYRVPYGKTRLGGIVPNNIAGTLSASSHEYNELVIEPIMQQNTGQIMQIGNTTENPWRDNPNTGRAYDPDGIAPALNCCGGGNLTPQIIEPQPLVTKHPYQSFGKVKFTDVAPTILSTDFKPHLVKEPISCAMRGRNPDRPSDRTSGIPTEQRIEIGGDIANCITTVQKDSMVAEPQAIGHYRPEGQSGDIPYGDYELRPKTDGIANAVTAQPGGKDLLIAEAVSHIIAPTVTTAHEPKIVEPMVSAHPLSHAHENPQPQTDVAPTLRATDYKCPPVAYEPVQYYYRIRKLTPKECFRLMDVDDPDIDKLIEAKDKKGKPELSKSACYKLAGNSIVVSCMFFIFENLFYPKSENQKQLKLF